MLPYITLALILLLFSFIPQEKKEEFYLLFISFFLLFSFAILRDFSVGEDFENYSRGFIDYGGEGKTNVRLEPAWYFIYKLFYLIGTFRVYVIFFYAILYFLILRFFWKQSEYPVLSVLLYLLLGFYFDSYNIMRQSFAALFVLYSTIHLFNRNFLLFSLLILIGSLFHLSVLFFFPFFFISKWLKDYKHLLSFFVVLSLISGYFNLINITAIVPENTMFDKYLMYLIMGERETISFMGKLINVFHSLVAISCIYLARTEKTKHFVFLFVIGICLNNIFYTYQWLFRLYNPIFIVFILLSITNVISEIKDKLLKILYTSLSLAYAFGIFYINLNNNLNGIIPYILFL